MMTILEVMTNHLGEVHDMDDVRACTFHNLAAIDVYNMLQEYSEDIIAECAKIAKELSTDMVVGRMTEVIISERVKKMIK